MNPTQRDKTDAGARQGRAAGAGWLAGVGLTLLELMVALGVSSIIISAALSVVVATQSASNTQTQRSYLQQAGRATLEILRDDLYQAGLGAPDQTLPENRIPEELDVFTPGNTNNSTSPDVLQFRSGPGALAWTTMDGGDIQLASGAQVSLTVPVGLEKQFKVVAGRPETALVTLFDRDRRFLGTGVMGGSPSPDSGVVEFIYTACSPDACGEDVPTVLKPFGTVVQAPPVITYKLDGDELVRCIDTGPNGACNDNNREVIIDNVEAFQVGFLFRGGGEVDVNWNLQERSRRLQIRGVRVYVLLRSPIEDSMVDDQRIYQVGNQAYRPAQTYSRHQRRLVLTTVRPVNFTESPPEG